MEFQGDSYVASSIPMFLIILFAVCTIIGNLMALLVLGQSSQLRSPAHLLMANLAALDFMTGVVVMTYTVNHALNGEIEQANGNPRNNSNADIACQTAGTFRVISITGSCYTLVALSYERYVAIAYPLKHFHMITTRSVSVYIIIIWTLATIVGVLPFFGVGQYQFSQHQFICWPQGSNGDAFVIVFVLSVFCATFIAMIVMYISLSVLLRSIVV